MKEIIYTTQPVAGGDSRKMFNPVHFFAPDPEAETVWVQEGYENIVRAYAGTQPRTKVHPLSALSDPPPAPVKSSNSKEK